MWQSKNTVIQLAKGNSVTTNYEEFIASKLRHSPPAGFDWPTRKLPKLQKLWQKKVTQWTLRRGRSAIFLDTGLGKTGIELGFGSAVAEQTGKPVLLLTPLAVGPQVIREAEKFAVKGVAIVASQEELDRHAADGGRIGVANYEKLARFNPHALGGIVEDESSIVKNYTGKIRNQLLEFVQPIPYRLMGTATPAPNDYEELGNHAELLGICTRVEMLATYFIHDSGDTGTWRLKGHAEVAFWEWVASWAMVARRPSDLGFEDEGYDLPPLEIVEHVIETERRGSGLFTTEAEGLQEVRAARRETLDARVARAAAIANGITGPCVIWCELNDEADAAEALIEGAVQVAGSDSDDAKAERLTGFSEGRIKKLVTKAKIAAFGMNWQHCCETVVVGPSYSYEQFYQLARRFWRYGQVNKVRVHVVMSDRETGVWDDVKKKQGNHEAMFEAMLRHTRRFNQSAIQEGYRPMSEETTVRPAASGEDWNLIHGDCVEEVRKFPSDSVDYSIYSPPFASLFTCSASPRDMSNCRGLEQFTEHYRFLVAELFRVLKPGRLVSFHCMNLPTSKERDGYIGIRDFRGDLIWLMQQAGFIYHSEVCIWKDPVVAMRRTKAPWLLHKQVCKDSCMSRQGIPDYLVTMRKPGKNAEPVAGEFDHFAGVDGPEPIRITKQADGFGKRLETTRYSIEVWQRYASPVWMDIDQSRTLNHQLAREQSDERHICPLQLDVIERAVEMWSNPGDLVLSPFAGIGSEGYQSLLMGRKFLGVELKGSYFDEAVKNLRRAVRERARKESSLFDSTPEEEPMLVEGGAA